MHSCEHHTIFYPNDPSTLKLQSAVRKELIDEKDKLTTFPCAILAPHAGYPFVLDALHKSFAPVASLKPKLVVILAPLHQEALEEDKPHFLFTPTGEGLVLPHTSVEYATDMRSTLIAHFPNAIKAENSYFVEEPAVELTLPLVASYAKGVPILSLLTATRDAKECRTYAAIVEKIVALVPETLFVISSNLTATLPAPLATEHASELVKLLEEGDPLLDSVRSKQISGCGIAAFEALRHQRWGTNAWVFTSFVAEGEAFERLPHEYKIKERIVWHASAKRKEV